MNRTDNSAQTVIKALSLLEAVAADIHDLSGLCQATGLPQSTAYRLLNTLTQADYLRRPSRQGYFLGPKLIELGFKAHGQLHLPSVARPHLRWLAQVTQDTVHLGTLNGQDIFYLDKIEGERELQMASYIGGRQPAPCTGLGKALIAALPPAERLQYAAAIPQRTPRTMTDPERFMEEMEMISRRGYALDLEENEQGIRCIAAPIYDAAGTCTAAVSISSATLYLNEERIEELIPVVQIAARRISQELGWPENKRTKE